MTNKVKAKLLVDDPSISTLLELDLDTAIRYMSRDDILHMAANGKTYRILHKDFYVDKNNLVDVTFTMTIID